MSFIEVDITQVGEGKSGDAIAIRYQGLGDSVPLVHVTDGGYAKDGPNLVAHIRKYYNNPARVEHVVLTHPDGDHAAGLEAVLEAFEVGNLWMNRPWMHVDELLPMFEYEYTREGLIRRLKDDFANTAYLEELAIKKGITVRDAFQGQAIGMFTVLSPTRSFYLAQVVESEKTPKAKTEAPPQRFGLLSGFLQKAAELISAVWGAEHLKGESDGTSADNEMSIVQFAMLNGKRVLLTGDAGVGALEEAHAYAVRCGIPLPGLDLFHVPHHGSRRNLSTDILDKWLGPRLASKPEPHGTPFYAIVSAHKDDEHHPKKAVIRALTHRGASISTTENGGICWSEPRIPRDGWGPAPLEGYPEETEA